MNTFPLHPDWSLQVIGNTQQQNTLSGSDKNSPTIPTSVGNAPQSDAVGFIQRAV